MKLINFEEVFIRLNKHNTYLTPQPTLFLNLDVQNSFPLNSFCKGNKKLVTMSIRESISITDFN